MAAATQACLCVLFTVQMNIRMKRYYFIFFALCLSLALSLFSACSKEADEIAPDQAEWTLKVSLSDMQNGISAAAIASSAQNSISAAAIASSAHNGTSAPRKISYSGTFGEHSEFETGDSFGLFVLAKNNDNYVIKFKNLKVYCSGFDNKGKSVWSIYKPLDRDGESSNGESPNGESSNYPIYEILSSGSLYYAYYPYEEGLETTITSLEQLKNLVPAHMNNLPMDQSDSYTKYFEFFNFVYL